MCSQLSKVWIVFIMDLESLRALVAFADAGCQLTAGGKAIALSQPAMHARLQGVAHDLDVVLYERRGKRLALTSEGTRVVAWAKDVLERERALRRALDGELDDDRVVVACGEGALVHVVAERVAPWLRAHPGQLTFVVVDGPGAVEAVRGGDAHLAVVAGPASHAKDLKTEPLLTTSLCAVAPRRHPAVRSASINLDVLLRHPLLLPQPGRPLRTTIEEAAVAHNVVLAVACEVTGWEAVARLARLGIGVGVVNDVVATPGLARASIRGLPSTTYRLLRRKGAMLAAVQAVSEALLADGGCPSR